MPCKRVRPLPDASDAEDPVLALVVPASPFEKLENYHLLEAGQGWMSWNVDLSGEECTLEKYQWCGDADYRRKIDIIRNSKNPYILRCHGYREDAEGIAVIFERFGNSLEGRHVDVEPMLTTIAGQALEGLFFLHDHKVSHGNIRPATIFVGKNVKTKIGDFTSRVRPPLVDSKSSAYLSPEVIGGDADKNFDVLAAGDIWSLGLSVLELFLGYYPYGKDLPIVLDYSSLKDIICSMDPPQAPAQASMQFTDFLALTLQKDPKKRSTAAKLLHHSFITG